MINFTKDEMTRIRAAVLHKIKYIENQIILCEKEKYDDLLFYWTDELKILKSSLDKLYNL